MHFNLSNVTYRVAKMELADREKKAEFFTDSVNI